MSDKPEEKILPQEMPDNHYTKMFNECYNVGVEHCIAVAKNWCLPHIEELIQELEQLKKPVQ